MAPGPGRPVSLVGRERELATLDQAAAIVAAGQPTVVVISGDAGIGKSRLIAEFLASLPTDAWAALTGHCPPHTAVELPFGAVVDMLHDLSRRPEIAAGLGTIDPIIKELAPSLPLALSDAEARTHPSAGGPVALFEALLTLLERLAVGHALVVVVEDIQWADPMTLDWLAFLSRSLRSARVLVILTDRTDDPRTGEPWAALAGEFHRGPNTVRLGLGPLPEGAANRIAGEVAGQEVEPYSLASVVARAGGNPYFVHELAAALANGEATLPVSLREALRDRIRALPAAAADLVRVAAAGGPEISEPLLCAVIDRPPAAVTAALRSAVTEHILDVTPNGQGSLVRFRQPLLRDAALSDMLPSEQRTLHGAIARALQEHPSLAPGSDLERAVSLARHWVAAGDAKEAQLALLNAAAAAETVYAFREATDLYEEALHLRARGPWRTPDTSDRSDSGSTWLNDDAEVWRRAAQAASLAGEPLRAVDRGRQAIALSPATGVAAAILRERQARYLWEAARPAESLGASEEALGLLPPGPSPERARVLSSRAQLLGLAGRHVEAAQAAGEAAATARSVGADAEEATALRLQSASLMHLGRRSEAGRVLEQARRVPITSVDLSRSRPSRIVDNIGALLAEADARERSGDLTAALDLSLSGHELAARLGVASTVGGLAAAAAARQLVNLGRWDDAEGLLATALADAVDRPTARIELEQVQGLLLTRRGRVTEAREAFRRAAEGLTDVSPKLSRIRQLLAEAELALWERQPLEAGRLIDRARVELVETEDRSTAAELEMLAIRAAADRAVLARDHRDQRAVADAIERATSSLTSLRVDTGEAEPEPRAEAIERTGMADLSRAEAHDEPAAWAAAVAAWERAGDPFAVAAARWRMAEARLTVGGDRGAAETELRDARRIASAIGADALLVEIEGLAQRARLSANVEPSTARGAAAVDADNREGRLGLSARELEVLRLVAQGRTNRQIAETLFITEKTAGHHVSNILGKLGVASRVEAAMIAHRNRILNEHHDPT